MFINTDFIFQKKDGLLKVKSTFRSETKVFSLFAE